MVDRQDPPAQPWQHERPPQPQRPDEDDGQIHQEARWQVQHEAIEQNFCSARVARKMPRCLLVPDLSPAVQGMLGPELAASCRTALQLRSAFLIQQPCIAAMTERPFCCNQQPLGLVGP